MLLPTPAERMVILIVISTRLHSVKIWHKLGKAVIEYIMLVKSIKYVKKMSWSMK